MRVAVAGATGRVGRRLVDVLRGRGHDVVAISRSNGVDVVIGAGLAEALEGVESVVDAASGPSPDQKSATDFFTSASRNLQEAGKRAGVQRLVVVSIVGIDRFTTGYAAAKIAHEKAMLAGPVPARILRATQFHELVGQFVEWGRQGDVSYVPRMRTQPVAARTVAEALADIATDRREAQSTAGTPIPEIAGPRQEDFVELARRFVARRGGLLRIEAVGHPDEADRALYETGGLLPGPQATLAGPSFDEWLGSTFPMEEAQARRSS